jgi:hypothetical protein
MDNKTVGLYEVDKVRERIDILKEISQAVDCLETKKRPYQGGYGHD